MYAEQAMPEQDYMGATRATNSSLIISTIKQVNELTDAALQANATICETRSRLFGPWPTRPTSAEKDNIREAPNGQASELSEAINRLRAVVFDARENAAALSSAL